MTKQLILKDEALDDVNKAADWYDQQRTGLENRFAKRVADSLNSIMASPLRYGKVWRQVRLCLVRSFPYVNYFRDLPSFIEVIAVFHGKRNPLNLKSRI